MVFLVDHRAFTSEEAAARHLLAHGSSEPVQAFVASAESWGTRSLTPVELGRLRWALIHERQLREVMSINNTEQALSASVSPSAGTEAFEAA
jgi:hypothetical protein